MGFFELDKDQTSINPELTVYNEPPGITSHRFKTHGNARN